MLEPRYVNYSLHVGVEGLAQAVQIGWVSTFERIKRLSAISESNMQGHLLLFALLPELSKGEYHVYLFARCANFWRWMEIKYPSKDVPKMLSKEVPLKLLQSFLSTL